MNLHALRIFSKVAETRSVTQTAEQLSLTQPAVTAQLRSIERDIGFPLIKRSGRGIALTEMGKTLYPYARQVFEAEKEVEYQIELLQNGKKGKLRISATYVPLNFLLPNWLAVFKMKAPHTEIELNSGNSTKVLNDLLQYQSDVAIAVIEDIEHEGIQTSHLIDLSYNFIVPAQHPLNGRTVPLERLAHEPFLMREEGSSTREKLFSLFTSKGIAKPTIDLQFSGVHEAIQMIKAGYGIALVPNDAVRMSLKRGEIGRVHVEGLEVVRPIYVCKRANDLEESMTVNAFLNMKNIHSFTPPSPI
ncbi:LysR family transcriptional regulator [Bacillus sp. NPDC077027]|uniref:LysR family transcriptional regulator n=1 Tax=Bacillus sp. NPDC077027 TaxID=3390548 RepID=UPI003D05BF67